MESCAQTEPALEDDYKQKRSLVFDKEMARV